MPAPAPTKARLSQPPGIAVTLSALVILAACPGSPALAAGAWSFGVMADTQWSGADPTGANINSVAINQINACNARFIEAGVEFVVQVGDLCNDDTDSALQTRLDANSALDAAGIAFYGLRGNHNSSDTSQTFFQANYLPASGAGATVSTGPDATSYAVTFDNAKIVLLDINVSTNAAALAAQTSWMDSELAAADHVQGFVFTHKPLLGQSQKDNLFGGGNDANPDLQNNFLASVAGNNVRYVISGHDHMHDRSYVTSPDGGSTVQQVICAPDGYHYCTPGEPYSSREAPISQEIHKTGFYIYTVDGPRISARYYSTTPLANGDVPAAAVWDLVETFGGSLNGTSMLVPQGGSYGMSHSIAPGSSFGEAGYVGTTMAILAGTNGSTLTDYSGRALSKDVNTGWAPAANGPPDAASDVLSIWGMSNPGTGQTDPFVLSLSYDPSGFMPGQLISGVVAILSRDEAGGWINTVDLNYGGNRCFVASAWEAGHGLGAYGIDTATNTAWAVVNHNSEFVVALVPEPSSLAAALGAAALGIAILFRRRKPSL